MKIKFIKSSVAKSAYISLFAHFLLIMIFSLIYFNNNPDEKFNGVYIEFNEIEKKIIPAKQVDDVKRKRKPIILPKKIDQNVIIDSDNVTKIEIPTEIVDSSANSKIDSISYYSGLLDSIVINFPSLLVLKSAMKEHIKNDPKIETDSALIVRRMRRYIRDYYKYKYPTPLSEFGDPNPGIPIDKILDIFSSEEEIDVKKIKKYLNLDTP